MKDSVIDKATIQEIRKLQKPGRPDLLKELITLFIESVQEHVKVLRAAVENKDLGTIAHMAHNIKSSAANLGALKLSKCCQDLETIGSGDLGTERLSKALQQTEEAYHEAADLLKTF